MYASNGTVLVGPNTNAAMACLPDKELRKSSTNTTLAPTLTDGVLEPRIDLLSEEYVLVQAWKKASCHFR